MDTEKVTELKEKLARLKGELKEHASQVADPKCAALCETSAEALGGLETAFQHYLAKEETAWQ